MPIHKIIPVIWLKWSLIFFSAIISHSLVFSQGFEIQKKKPKYVTSFELIGNLIVIKTSINGSNPLNFILDSGAGHLIVTNLQAIETLDIKKGKEFNLKGLGNGFESIAYYSPKNHVKIGKIVNEEMDLVLLFNSELQLSQRLGIPIHGVIGYEVFKNLVIDINYKKRVLKFYEPEYFHRKKFKKITSFKKIPLLIENRKSFIQLKGVFPEGEQKNLKLLIDTGSWNAIWLFEKEEIIVPEKNIDDFLGYGINGPIRGKRSRIKNIQIASETLLEPTTSFPDSLSLKGLNIGERDGTIGGEILRRFRLIFDYPNRMLYLQKNNSIKDKFFYNMAGLELSKPFLQIPVYQVDFVRENSPAHIAGIKKGDVIQEFNSYKPSEISLNEIYEIFRSKEGEKINITFTRENLELRYATFTLKRLI